jgi:hypothetical protein
MIIYNVTIQIEENAELAWLQWMQDSHIPDMMATGCFTRVAMLRLLLQEGETAEGTYAIQYFSNSMEDYERYLRGHASEMRNRTLAAWGNRFVAFRTVLEELV